MQREDKERLVNEKIILRQCELEDEYKGLLIDCPFFHYEQDWPDLQLLVKQNNPPDPVKESQLPAKIQSEAIRFPFSFAETDSFKITEYMKCKYWFWEDDPEYQEQ